MGFVRTPIFALQSAFDSWQVANEMASGQNTSNASVNAYGEIVRRRLRGTLLAAPRHGAFIDSCSHHCFAWGHISIRGSVQAKAHSLWYYNQSTAGARHGALQYRVWEQADAFPCEACCRGGGGR